jgi:hypothetical protein
VQGLHHSADCPDQTAAGSAVSGHQMRGSIALCSTAGAASSGAQAVAEALHCSHADACRLDGIVTGVQMVLKNAVSLPLHVHADGTSPPKKAFRQHSKLLPRQHFASIINLVLTRRPSRASHGIVTDTASKMRLRQKFTASNAPNGRASCKRQSRSASQRFSFPRTCQSAEDKPNSAPTRGTARDGAILVVSEPKRRSHVYCMLEASRTVGRHSRIA